MAARDSAELTPFETDGCSGGLSYSWQVVADTFPDFADAHNQKPPWELCCVLHDRAYHDAGGAATAQDSYQARLDADKALETCVKETGDTRLSDLADHYGVDEKQIRSAYDAIANAMYLAVRFGGGPCTGLPWRWGFGYPSCTPFDNLSPARD